MKLFEELYSNIDVDKDDIISVESSASGSVAKVLHQLVVDMLQQGTTIGAVLTPTTIFILFISLDGSTKISVNCAVSKIYKNNEQVEVLWRLVLLAKTASRLENYDCENFLVLLVVLPTIADKKRNDNPSENEELSTKRKRRCATDSKEKEEEDDEMGLIGIMTMWWWWW